MCTAILIYGKTLDSPERACHSHVLETSLSDNRKKKEEKSEIEARVFYSHERILGNFKASTASKGKSLYKIYSLVFAESVHTNLFIDRNMRCKRTV